MGDLILRNRVPQVVVGLCRAAFAQSIAIATLTVGGLGPSAAANRRLFLEIALRLHWLADLSPDDRRLAVDSMLAKDRKDTNTTVNYLRELGHEVDFDPTEMNDFELDAKIKGVIQEQARKLAEVEPWAIYSLWREESKHAHASGALAGQYAPTFDDAHLGMGEPDPMDPDLEAHRLVQCFIVISVGKLLQNEGVRQDIADRIPATFFNVS